jgi:hypothetical protein
MESLDETNALLRQILNQLAQPKLGFTEAPTLFWIYANRSNNCLWYTMKNGKEIVPIEATALTAYLKEIKFEKVTRRNKEETKLRVYLKGDRYYCIESGYDTHFSKSLLSCIASLNPEKLVAAPITISPTTGTDDSVLFCRCYYKDEPIFAPYNEETNWREIAVKAKANCPKKPNNFFPQHPDEIAPQHSEQLMSKHGELTEEDSKGFPERLTDPTDWIPES